MPAADDSGAVSILETMAKGIGRDSLYYHDRICSRLCRQSVVGMERVGLFRAASPFLGTDQSDFFSSVVFFMFALILDVSTTSALTMQNLQRFCRPAGQFFVKRFPFLNITKALRLKFQR